MFENDGRMKPIIILPVGAMTAQNIKTLNENGLCVVEAKDPSAVKFLDPIPSAAERTKHEQAAIALGRKILSKEFYDRYGNSMTVDRADVAKTYIDLLVAGTSLDPAPSKTEIEKETFDSAKADELRRLARDEAKAERVAAKARADKAAKPTGK